MLLVFSFFSRKSSDLISQFTTNLIRNGLASLIVSFPRSYLVKEINRLREITGPQVFLKGMPYKNSPYTLSI